MDSPIISVKKERLSISKKDIKKLISVMSVSGKSYTDTIIPITITKYENGLCKLKFFKSTDTYKVDSFI